MSIANYRFIIEKATVQTAINPIGTSDIVFQYTKEKDQIFFRRELKGELILKDADYTYFKTDYDAGKYCNVYTLYVEKKCAGVWAVDWMGTFSIPDLIFDFDRCTVKIKDPEVLDKYSCFFNERIKDEINICDFTYTNIIAKTNSYFLFAILTDYPSQGSLPATYSYNYYSDNGGSSVSFDLIYTQDTGILNEWVGIYAREFKKIETGQVPTGGYGWSLNVTNLDEFDIYSRTFLSYNSIPGVTDAIIYLAGVYDSLFSYELIPRMYKAAKFGFWDFYVLPTYYEGSKIDLINEITYKAASLNNLLNILYYKCDTFTLSSDFFTNATNPVTNLPSKTNNIYFIQKSDAKRPHATQKATKGFIKIEDLFKYLLYTFQVYWYLDDSDHIVFIHISELTQGTGIDLTTYETALHHNQIEFIKDYIVKEEVWEWMEAKGADFVGLPITYSCVSKEKTEFNLSDITTDLGYIQNYPEDISDDGFVIVATDGTDIINETGLISGATILNGHMSLANLHYNYWRHDRPLPSGNMNGSDETFLSTKHLQKLAQIAISLCCVDFDPFDKLTHSLGTVYVDSAEFSIYDEKLKLNLVK